MSDEEFTKYEVNPAVVGLVAGYDPDFNYRKLCIASLHLQLDGAKFIATNYDKKQEGRGGGGAKNYITVRDLLAICLLLLKEMLKCSHNNYYHYFIFDQCVIFSEFNIKVFSFISLH